MNSIFKLAAPLLLLASAATAMATNWIKLYEDSQSSAYVDLESIEKNGSIVKFWLRIDYLKIENGMHQIKLLQEVNCNSREYRVLYVIRYFENGKMDSEKYGNDWRILVPDSFGDGAADRLCN